jgi:hypothetical protein
MIDAKMEKLFCDGNDDLTILGEMFDYVPGFKRLMDTSEPGTMDELCRRLPGFFHYAKILGMVEAGIQSGAIKVPKQVGYYIWISARICPPDGRDLRCLLYLAARQRSVR